MSKLTKAEHIKEAIKCSREAKALKAHIAYLKGDAFNIQAKIDKLDEKANWHLDYANAIVAGTEHFMWRLI